MTSKRVYETLIKSYEQILILRIPKFKSYLPRENGSLLMGKAKLLMEKGYQPLRNIEKFFIVMGALNDGKGVSNPQIFIDF